MNLLRGILITLLFAFTHVNAVEYDEIIIYRGMDGKLPAESRHSLAILGKEARQLGSVKIWIMLDVKQEPNPAKRNAETKRAEAAEKATMISSVVKPSSDVTLLATPDGLEKIPGAMLVVTERGLKALAKDKRVTHITYHP